MEQYLYPRVIVRPVEFEPILFKLDKPVTPTALAKELNLHRSVISRPLLNLEKHGLVTCLNPESRKERYYKVTKKGTEIKKQIEKMSV